MPAKHPKFKAAVVQAAPAFLDLDAGVNKAVLLIEDAAKNGASIIAFPEVWMPGYPWWIWLGAPAWGMQFVQRYYDNSLIVGGEEFARLQGAAADNGIYVLIGYSEKDGGSLYLGQALIGADGEVVYTRRKLKPTHVERTVFGEGDGSSLTVSETELGRVGALCCWEHLQPLSKYAMYSMNEQLHIASWPSFSLYSGMAYALGPELNSAASQMYAAEGQCFVLAACGVVSKEMVELMCDTPDKRELLKPGGGYAMIYAPDGAPLAQSIPPDHEGLLFAEVDLGLISIAKAAADPVGHYSRPDVTRLLLNSSPAPCVESFDLPLRPVDKAVATAQEPDEHGDDSPRPQKPRPLQRD